ncbi:sugar transferase [Terricaulis sp.]|uniref:sugar transferase n=1 Tax=Terricaulis sp. TaxID=2768686 RepID=UPI003783C0F2
MSEAHSDYEPARRQRIPVPGAGVQRISNYVGGLPRWRRPFMHAKTQVAAPARNAVALSKLLVPEGANGSYPGKRVMDVAVAVGLLLLLLPVMGLVWLAVRMTSKGPGLIWSERVGRFGRVFLMPKFRSMRTDAPILPREALPDPKVYDTSIGAFLRKSSLDELPQLWSIVIGDMSLVGPRPLIRQDSEMHTLRARGSVYRARPGMTGAAQVNGRNLVENKAKVALDEQYVERASLLLDLRLILKTVLVLSRPSMVMMF